MLTAESYLEILDFRMKTNSGRIRSTGKDPVASFWKRSGFSKFF